MSKTEELGISIDLSVVLCWIFATPGKTGVAKNPQAGILD